MQCDWSWDAKERVNLSECPTNSWEEAYHWLDDQVGGEVVVRLDEDLNFIGYICEVSD